MDWLSRLSKRHKRLPDDGKCRHASRQTRCPRCLAIPSSKLSGTTGPDAPRRALAASWAIVGDAGDGAGLTCLAVKAQTRDLGDSAYDAKHAYYSHLFGVGLPFESVERSPLPRLCVLAALVMYRIRGRRVASRAYAAKPEASRGAASYESCSHDGWSDVVRESRETLTTSEDTDKERRRWTRDQIGGALRWRCGGGRRSF